MRAEFNYDSGKGGMAGLGFSLIGDALPFRNCGFRFKKDGELAVKSVGLCY